MQSCKYCPININYNFDNNKYFALCPSCYNKIILYSKTYCLKNLKLKAIDLNDIKSLFRKKNMLFDSNDINALIINKFDSLEKHKSYILNRYNVSLTKVNKMEQIKSERKKQLYDVLSEHKIEYKPYGNCYSYVNCGKPTLTTIIKEELNKMFRINEKRQRLLDIFNEKNIIYNENMKYIKNYLYNDISLIVDNKSIDEIVNLAQTDDFFIKNTNYLKLLETHDEEDAKEMALIEYSKTINLNHQNHQNHKNYENYENHHVIKQNKIVINFDNF